MTYDKKMEKKKDGSGDGQKLRNQSGAPQNS